MSANKFNTDIPDAIIKDILLKLDAIALDLKPYLVTLSESEKRHLPKIADASLAFAQKTDGYIDTEPGYNPPFMDAVETHKDFANYQKVKPVFEKINGLQKEVSNISVAAGSDAYVQYLGYYNSVKKATLQGIPGAKTIYDDLAKRFPGAKTKTPVPPVPPIPPVTP